MSCLNLIPFLYQKPFISVDICIIMLGQIVRDGLPIPEATAGCSPNQPSIVQQDIDIIMCVMSYYL
jgi:hypothetical protein